MWPRICPVCREELPERGNRRVYVSWKRGFRLVHSGACFDAIDAQGVLELETKPPRIDPVVLVRARAYVQRVLDRYEPAEHTVEELLAIRRRVWVPLHDQDLVGDEGLQDRKRSVQELRNLVDRVLAHDREVSGATRTELFA